MDTLNQPAPQAMNLLRTRRSAKAAAMTGPGPDPAELAAILNVAARVPDHGKLAPWRFIVFQGTARNAIGDVLARILAGDAPEDAPPDETRLQRERDRFLRAPLVIGVISHIVDNPKIPEWEQILSAGAACQNLLLAVHTLGYVGTWLTEWYAYHPIFHDHLGLEDNERIAGFIYIGKSTVPLSERPRTEVTELTRYYGH